MKMKSCIIFLLSFGLALPVLADENQPVNDEDGQALSVQIDLLPMYGSTPEYGGWQKTAEEEQADESFLQESDQIEPNRKLASLDYIELGWKYIEAEDWETAMRRANQAWQLDSQNADVYTLYAAILNMHGVHDESLDMLERAIDLNPLSVNLYYIYLSESIDLHQETNDDYRIRRLISMLEDVEDTGDEEGMKLQAVKNHAVSYLQ